MSAGSARALTIPDSLASSPCVAKWTMRALGRDYVATVRMCQDRTKLAAL
jgi:hypothetical protein